MTQQVVERKDRGRERPVARRTVLGAGLSLVLHEILTGRTPARAAEEAYPEYEVKATLLVKILRFVAWPKEDGKDHVSPIDIGVLGNDPFGPELDKAVADKEVDGRTLRVRRAKKLSDLGGCDVLFLAQPATEDIPSIRPALRAKPVLTVGDQEGLCQQGVMINLVRRGEKVHFEINYGAFRAAGLDVAPQLLKLATLVDTATEEDKGDGAEPNTSPS